MKNECVWGKWTGDWNGDRGSRKFNLGEWGDLFGTVHLETSVPKAQSINCFSVSYLQKKHSVLMSVVAGEAVASIRKLDDKQVLQQCMATLRELFKEQVRAALWKEKDMPAVSYLRVLFRVGGAQSKPSLPRMKGWRQWATWCFLPISTFHLSAWSGLLGLPQQIPQPVWFTQWKFIF